MKLTTLGLLLLWAACAALTYGMVLADSNAFTFHIVGHRDDICRDQMRAGQGWAFVLALFTPLSTVGILLASNGGEYGFRFVPDTAACAN